MYAYLNEISMQLSKGQKGNSWKLLSEVICISQTIWDDYSIEYIKVPNNFKSIKIANEYSLSELINLSDEEFDQSNKLLIIDFLGNRTFAEIDEVEEEILKEIETKNTWIQVNYKGVHSFFLTGAYLLDMPSVSFQTENEYEVDYLPCEYIIEYDDTKKSKEVRVKNLYENSQINNHNTFLINIKKDIKFGKGNWNPLLQPIWNEKTGLLIVEMEFPQSVVGKKDKIAELKEVGKKIAILNGWRFDNEITKINSNKGQIRIVFVSESQTKKAYLSIDVKNAYGRFEHHNDKGYHIGEIDFTTGKPVPRGTSETGKDKTGKHNLRLKK